MISILAQIPTATEAGISSWLIDAAAIGAIVLIFVKLLDHFKAKPPMDQQVRSMWERAEARFASKEELGMLRGEILSRYQTLKELIEESEEEARVARHEILASLKVLNAQGEDRAIALHNRINALLEKISYIDGKTRTQALRAP